MLSKPLGQTRTKFLILSTKFAIIVSSSGKPNKLFNEHYIVPSEDRRYAASRIPLCSKPPEAAERFSVSADICGPSLIEGKDGWMKNINYYGHQVTVSDEVAEFLEQDRRRKAAQERSDRRHLNYVCVDIASIPDLFTNAHSDPTFEQAYRNLRLEALRKAYQTLSDDERKLICLYYYHEFSMEEIGRRSGVTKMAISKRLRKILDHLRGLMEDEAP